MFKHNIASPFLSDDLRQSIKPVALSLLKKKGLQQVKRGNVKTIYGHPVSEEQIDAWVAEAENGYDVETLHRRGRKPRNEDAAKVISIRLSPREILDLDKYAATHGWPRSQAIREALKNAI